MGKHRTLKPQQLIQQEYAIMTHVFDLGFFSNHAE